MVFNGLYEDLQNWSSYGPNTPYGYPEITGGDARTPGVAGGLAAPSDEPHAALRWRARLDPDLSRRRPRECSAIPAAVTDLILAAAIVGLVFGTRWLSEARSGGRRS